MQRHTALDLLRCLLSCPLKGLRNRCTNWYCAYDPRLCRKWCCLAPLHKLISSACYDIASCNPCIELHHIMITHKVNSGKTALCLIKLLCLLVPSTVYGSAGDRDTVYQLCVADCVTTGCVSHPAAQPECMTACAHLDDVPLSLRALSWTCQDDCRCYLRSPVLPSTGIQHGSFCCTTGPSLQYCLACIAVTCKGV